jgi:DNA invertase Pin-like site-specific DNA recombinase
VSDQDALRLIRELGAKRRKADQMKREATEELARFCREAKRAGVPITLIASEAGLSRQGVYDLLAEPPSA